MDASIGNISSNAELSKKYKIQQIKSGDGVTFAEKGQEVIVHYTGTLENGKKFDSSRDKGRPFTFKVGVGQVIKGWDELVGKMSVGEQISVTIPADHAYGSREIPGLIPANSPLVFDIELLQLGKK